MGTVTLGLTIAFLLIVLWQAFRGYIRGPYRQTLHISTSIIAAIVAYFMTKGLANGLLDAINADTIGEVLDRLGSAELAKFAPYLTNVEWFLVLPVATLVAPGIFVSSYFLLDLVLNIIAWIVRIIFKIPRTPGETGKNFIGAAIGLVEGLLIAFMVFLPITAVTNLVGGGVDAICEADTEGHIDGATELDEELSKLENHFAIKLVNSVGGKSILGGLATIQIDGEDVNLVDESETIVKIILEFTSIKSSDFASVDNSGQYVLRSAADSIGDSVYLSTMISGILSDMGRAAQDKVIPFEANPPYDELLYSLFSIFATSNKDNLEADIHTILDVYFLLSDGGSLKAYGSEGGEDDMKNAMISKDESGMTLITKVVNILNENEHTKPLVTTLTKMTMTMMAEQLGGEYDVAEAYDKVKAGFESVASIDRENYGTDEEYEAARDEQLSTSFAENGIELDNETVNQIGDYIDENYPDKDELTDEEMNDILLYYYDVYAKDLEGSVE